VENEHEKCTFYTLQNICTEFQNYSKNIFTLGTLGGLSPQGGGNGGEVGRTDMRIQFLIYHRAYILNLKSVKQHFDMGEFEGRVITPGRG